MLIRSRYTLQRSAMAPRLHLAPCLAWPAIPLPHRVPLTRVSDLRSSAKQALIWGAGFNLLRDVLQFASMLMMVRLLSPEDYGRAALAQAIVGFISVFSFGTFVSHALQARAPEEVDWQAHFSAGLFINAALFVVTALVAFALSFTSRYHALMGPLIVSALVFVVEIPGSLRHSMLTAHHEWRRFHTLTSVGTMLALAAGLVTAWMGGSVWALVIQSPLFTLPAAIDLFWGGRWKPDFSWSCSRYRDTAIFAVHRIGATGLTRGRVLAEQMILTASHSLSALGIFTRAIGLATLLAGRVGALVMSALYPIITRADPSSDRFRKMAGLVLRGVAWATLPAAACLAVCANDVVRLLYGEKWLPVTALLPWAVAGIAVAGVLFVLVRLLLANEAVKGGTTIDMASSLVAIVISAWLIPVGIEPYLLALAVHGAVFTAISALALVRSGGMTWHEFHRAWVPAVLAAAVATAAVIAERHLLPQPPVAFGRLLLDALVFVAATFAVLRTFFATGMRELVEVAPASRALARVLFLQASR
jgi:O-antigen/teichoic acid export membrane protein